MASNKETQSKPKKQVKQTSDGPRSTTQRLISNRAGAKPEARTDLPILQHGVANNFFEFERSIVSYVRREYGDMCSVITEGKMPKVEEFEESEMTGAARGEYKSYISKLFEYRFKTKCDNMLASQKIAGLIFAQLSRISEEKVREHKDWAEVEKKMRAVELWKLIKATHSTSIIGVTESDRQAARSRFQNCRQYSKDESISEFKRRFDDAVIMLKATGATEPTAQELATEFTYKLDRGKYAKYWAQLENLVTMGAATFPTTLAEAYNKATRFVVVSERDGKVRSSESVFNTHTASNTIKEAKPKKQEKKEKSDTPHPNKQKNKKQKHDHQHTKACLATDKVLLCHLCG